MSRATGFLIASFVGMVFILLLGMNNGVQALSLSTPTATITPSPTPSGTLKPPALRSNKFLNDLSLIKLDPPSCKTPCFRGIVPGKTTFTEAIAIIKADKAFANVQSNDKPPSASWSVTSSGELCCQMTANQYGIVDALVVKVAPNMTLRQVIYKYGPPQYTFPVDYASDEVAFAVIYPENGIVAWVSPGNEASTVDGNAQVVIILYFDPKDWATKYLPTGMLDGWSGYKPYRDYQIATPVITPAITPTP